MATTALGYAATAGAAFTTTQWKELERQAMIYKYMVASVPVPPHLLLPLSPSPPDSDPEAGRCKRTDGKKWRCSRDVAPHHKYCERHMHRGRPRSRKPVELSPAPTKKTRLHLPPPTTLSTPPPPSPRLLGSTLSGNKPSSLLPQDTSLSLYSNRGMDLMMEREMIRKEDASKQQLQDYMNGGFIYGSTASPSIFQQNYGDEQQLNSLSLPEIADSYNNDFNLFLNPYDQPPRDFIDAWSNNNNLNSERNNNDDSSSANGNLSPCSLNLSMAMGVGNSLDDEMGEIQMGETNRETTNQRCQGLSWLSPVSWIDSEPGGPLAEVLRPSHLNFSSDPGYAGKNGDGSAISHPATSAPSSPSGVLHRTMLSLSDTSVCNSPTVVATSAGAGEIVGFPCLG